VQTPFQAPNANAHAERFVRSIIVRTIFSRRSFGMRRREQIDCIQEGPVDNA